MVSFQLHAHPLTQKKIFSEWSSLARALLTSGPQKGPLEGAYILSEGRTPFARTLLSILFFDSFSTLFRPLGPRGPGNPFSDFFRTLGPKGPNDPCSRRRRSQSWTLSHWVFLAFLLSRFSLCSALSKALCKRRLLLTTQSLVCLDMRWCFSKRGWCRYFIFAASVFCREAHLCFLGGSSCVLSLVSLPCESPKPFKLNGWWRNIPSPNFKVLSFLKPLAQSVLSCPHPLKLRVNLHQTLRWNGVWGLTTLVVLFPWGSVSCLGFPLLGISCFCSPHLPGFSRVKVSRESGSFPWVFSKHQGKEGQGKNLWRFLFFTSGGIFRWNQEWKSDPVQFSFWRIFDKVPTISRRSLLTSWEVLNGVVADGVEVKFPIFLVDCSWEKSEEKREKPKKNEERKITEKATEKRRKTNNKRKTGRTSPSPSTPTPLRASQTRQPPKKGTCWYKKRPSRKKIARNVMWKGGSGTILLCRDHRRGFCRVSGCCGLTLLSESWAERLSKDTYAVSRCQRSSSRRQWARKASDITSTT